MPAYVNPVTNNIEQWAHKPEGYLTVDEWKKTLPAPEIPAPDPEALRQAEIESVKARLKELDGESIRALRAIADGTETDEDRARLAAICEEAEGLRQKLRELERGSSGL